MVITCPICELPLRRVRPALDDEHEHQRNLPPGWDCPLRHAETVPPADYERARVERLIDEITDTLDKLRDGVPLTEPHPQPQAPTV